MRSSPNMLDACFRASISCPLSWKTEKVKVQHEGWVVPSKMANYALTKEDFISKAFLSTCLLASPNSLSWSSGTCPRVAAALDYRSQTKHSQ